MTIQEAFDKVWSWFVVRGNRRAIEGAICKLRTSRGDKCAVGVLIPDEQYDSLMDASGNIAHLILNRGVKIPALAGLEVDFLLSLQHAHDYAASKVGMKRALTEFARKWHLTIPETINTLDFKDKSDGQAKFDSPQAVAGGVGMAPAGASLEPAGNPAATCRMAGGQRYIQITQPEGRRCGHQEV